MKLEAKQRLTPVLATEERASQVHEHFMKARLSLRDVSVALAKVRDISHTKGMDNRVANIVDPLLKSVDELLDKVRDAGPKLTTLVESFPE